MTSLVRAFAAISSLSLIACSTSDIDRSATRVGEEASSDDGQRPDNASTTVLGSTAPTSSVSRTTESPSSKLAVPEGGDWEIVFFDDFNGDTLRDDWNTCHWWQVDGGCTIGSNDEQQWYRPEAVSLGEGDLRLRATADPQLTTDGDSLPFRSGMVTTGPVDDSDETSSFAFTYGEVSVRAMVPTGDGTWPAVWLLSADKTSLPEIDIVEWHGNRPDLVTSHVHNRVDGERATERVESSVEDFAGEWHVFRATWLPDRVVFAIDGVETGRVTDPSLIPSTPMYLVANLALGGPAGPVDDDRLPLTFRIDEIVVSKWSGT
ncbi:MAG: glycoside hydrolase family 16 protein [Actinomycetia bacterium]|nr:glycoside hydrolase family 16 protein [Actinomycetes bacterium]